MVVVANVCFSRLERLYRLRVVHQVMQSIRAEFVNSDKGCRLAGAGLCRKRCARSRPEVVFLTRAGLPVRQGYTGCGACPLFG